MAITPEVIEMMAMSRARVVELTDQQVRDLTARWVDAWDDLAGEIDSAVTRMVAQAGPGGVVNAGSIQRDARIRRALARAHDMLDQLGSDAVERIALDLPAVVGDAAGAHVAHLEAQLPDEIARLRLGYLDEETLDSIVARTTQQIHAASLPLSAASVSAMRAELVRGIVVGDNPNRVAQLIMRRTQGAFEGGLVRATRIARTEMLDAYRRTNQLSAIRNRQLIQERVWIATLDSRTCGSCLAQHGSTWPAEEFGPADHQQGRCTFIDKTVPWSQIDPSFADLDDGEDIVPDRDVWWNNLTEGSQNATLGRAKADLLRRGEISWSDLSTKRSTPDWRDSFTETPLRDLLP